MNDEPLSETTVDSGATASPRVRIDVASEQTRTTGATLFSLRQVAVDYGDFRAVNDITLDVPSNEITALIGPSGCGKTTVLRCLNRMNDLIESARVHGSILYHGVDLYGPHIDPV